MFEGACIPLLAKQRWPAISADTEIMLVGPHYRYRLIVQDKKPSPLSLRWTWEEEDVVLHRTFSLEPIMALGYGPRSNTLLLGVNHE